MRSARELVLGTQFWLSALLLVLPFAVTLVIAIAILRQLDRGAS